jgi:hypothetical protein
MTNLADTMLVQEVAQLADAAGALADLVKMLTKGLIFSMRDFVYLISVSSNASQSGGRVIGCNCHGDATSSCEDLDAGQSAAGCRVDVNSLCTYQ